MPFLIKTCLLLLISTACLSQVQPIYLQLEEINSTDLIKFYPGQKIRFSTKEYPDAWRTEKIVELVPEDNLIILTNDFISPDDIYSVITPNTGAIVFGTTLTTFATGWLVYGGYASLLDQGYKISKTEILIGAVAAGLGWLFRKVAGKKKHPMGKFYRLRIMDIRFPEPYIQTP